ncbi:DUF262 domain-containing protein [Roseococcus sp. SDR]|uniref:DUF262 domain-containing protein n=1 Tax=Roseococcus sp. SDR TaxID=2835532 RepID=UPI001BCCFD7E|nr:DUF262 domain-containing protein [Roseococcus sp. SDR]MBS7792601.1 DUF262 domain-containing protein [Roseococcus sp. SDR]MBV1847915.1 DUF262 domain-containing protein [Roseococcus sp. SDR]
MTDIQQKLADKLFPISKEEDIEVHNIPPEQRRLHTEAADYTISTINSYLSENKIQVPDFQRNFVWTRGQASRLIESLIIQCPIPVIYLNQTSDNKLQVIDGNQRLQSIRLFLANAYQLQGLTTYPELNGLRWSELDPRFRDHINNRTLRCITILRDTHSQIKYDVFERLNTGSVKLNAQELRYGISNGRLMKLLDRVAKNHLFVEMTGVQNDKRMRLQELALRYFAFRHWKENYKKPLSSFLDRFAEVHQSVKRGIDEKWENEFIEILERVNSFLGKDAFRLLLSSGQFGGQFNAAVYDAQMIAFATTTNKAIIDGSFPKSKLKNRIVRLFSDEKFHLAVTRATSDEQAVETRVALFRQILDRAR